MGCLGLAKQLLAGDKGLFIGIFPEIAEDEAAFLFQICVTTWRSAPASLKRGSIFPIVSCHSRSDSNMSDLLLYFAVM